MASKICKKMDGKKFIEIKKPVEIVHEVKGDEYKVPIRF